MQFRLSAPYRKPLGAIPNIKRILFIPTLISYFGLLLLAFVAAAFFYGTFVDVEKRMNNLRILVVDYDKDGFVGQSLKDAYSRLKRDRFPTVEFKSADSYPESADVKHEVCEGPYWAMIYVLPGASANLQMALRSTSNATATGINSVVIGYNGIRSPMAANILETSLQQLTREAGKQLYRNEIWRIAVSQATLSNPTTWRLLLEPITAKRDIISPDLKSMKTLYNTTGLLWPTLFTFFLCLSLTLRFLKNGLYARARPKDIFWLRFTIGKLWSLALALISPGPLWTIGQQWPNMGNRFGSQWLVCALYYDILWQVFETFVGGLLNMRYASPFMASWILVNSASCILPFELMPGFYKIGYAFPQRQVWVLLASIWSGCRGEYSTTLPILFSWWVVGHGTAWLGTVQNCVNMGGGPPGGAPGPPPGGRGMGSRPDGPSDKEVPKDMSSPTTKDAPRKRDSLQVQLAEIEMVEMRR